MKKIQSFSSKLMVLFSLSIILPITIMILVLCVYFTNILSNQNILQFKNTLSSVSSNINTYIDDLKRLTLTPYMYKEISLFMESINNGSYEKNITEIDRFIKSKNYSSTLNKIINQSREDILGITFIPYSNQSKGFLVSKYYDTLNQVDIPYSYNPWLSNALHVDGDTYFTPVHSYKYTKSGSEYQIFSVMRVIKNLDTNKVIGTIKIDVKATTIKNIISSVNISDNSIFILMDQNSQIIHSVNFPSNKDVSDIVFSNKNLSKDYNIVSTPIESSNWILLYLGSKKDLYSEVDFVFKVTLIISLLCIIVAIIFFRINSNKMIKSITNITSTMKKVRDGDLSVRCITLENDELKFISDALNKMIVNLDNHIKNEYSSLIAVKNAEYLALQSQINPHFLCNILNGFVALNRIGEKQLLEDSIIQLSSLYRYTCSNTNVATLKDEFDFIERYLTLQKLRFDDMIDFKISLDERIANIDIPKLILQPLVENSIKHGIKNYNEPIFITIIALLDTTSSDVETLKIIISDNGAGFIKEKYSSKNSTGLNNVKERVEFFKTGANFTISGIENEGTDCYIEIPIGGGLNENTNS